MGYLVCCTITSAFCLLAATATIIVYAIDYHQLIKNQGDMITSQCQLLNCSRMGIVRCASYNRCYLYDLLVALNSSTPVWLKATYPISLPVCNNTVVMLSQNQTCYYNKHDPHDSLTLQLNQVALTNDLIVIIFLSIVAIGAVVSLLLLTIWCWQQRRHRMELAPLLDINKWSIQYEPEQAAGIDMSM